ncbi:hypothetical protein [Hirschia maritima]|uniref:hypothetical protein n=1 Tax=Hirschia maritima TaxID=1121961 RepID=UPI000375BC2E|nr:hypothetical protein [Hirschia maritima]
MPFRLKRSQADIKQALLDRGVSAEVADYALDEVEAPQAYEFMTWLVVMLWFAGIFIGVQFIWPIMVEFSKTAAHNAAKTTDAILFDYSFGPALLLGAVAWVFICLSIPGLVLAAKPELRKSLFTGLVSDKTNGFVAKHFLKKVNTEDGSRQLSPEGFIKSFFSKVTSFMEWQAILLSLLTAGFVYLEFQAHTFVSTKAIIEENILPFFPAQTHSLSNVSHVELGCNYTDEDMSHLNYTIHFEDGAKIDLGTNFAVSGKWIDQAEKIDTILVSQNTEFKRWTWPGRTSLHPKCIDRYAAKFGANGYDRVNQLLRVDQQLK